MLQAIVMSKTGAMSLIIDGEEMDEGAVPSERISVAEAAAVRKIKPTALPAFVAAKAKGAVLEEGLPIKKVPQWV